MRDIFEQREKSTTYFWAILQKGEDVMHAPTFVAACLALSLFATAECSSPESITDWMVDIRRLEGQDLQAFPQALLTLLSRKATLALQILV